MKQQSSLNLKINDNPVNSNALENSLMLRATNSGLKLFNSAGEELPICSSVFKVQEFPTSGMVENSIYILESGEAKAYFAEGWIDISQEVVETINDSASNDNIPTTKAVKDYINTQLESSIDLSNYYNKTESDEKFALKENTVSYTFTTENSLNTIPITNGQAVICEDSEKLYIDKTDTRISIGDLIIVEASTDLPEIPLNKLYFVKETDKLYIYSNNTWVSINPNQFIDPNRLLPSTAENGNLLQYYIETGNLVTPTGLNETSQQDGEDWKITYTGLNTGSGKWYKLFDGQTDIISMNDISTYSLPCEIIWEYKNGGQKINKLQIYPYTQSMGEGYYAYRGPSEFTFSGSNDGQAWTTLLTVTNYLWQGDIAEWVYKDRFFSNSWFFENNNAFTHYKLEIAQASSRGVQKREYVDIVEIQGYGENRGWRLISVDDIKSDIALDLSNYQQENNISIASTNGSISLSGTDFVINGNTSNTSGGLAIVEESGKLPSSIIPDVDLSNYYNKTESDEKFALKDDVNSKLTLSVVEDFPTSGINNTLYVNNENHAQIYANDQWKDIALEVVENLDNPNQTTVPTTQAVKDYVDTIQVGPSMKTEATTNAIIFKKDISIYKIEVANVTTFTFDFSQLDENNCYTFELWVSMSTPVALTFPSDVAWLNDEVPDMSETSTYCIVVRKLPATMGTSTITSPKALLNLAYQYPVVLG